MKITQGATQNSKVAVRLECNKGNGVLVYGEVTFSSAYMDGQYHVFTVPLTGGPYQSLVSSNGVLDGFRLVLTGAEGVTYTVDYIYIGPLKESVLPGESLCFGFENSAQDQNRYSNETYSGINFDRWDGNATANKANWATAYGPSASATDTNGSGTDFIMDNRIGTLTVYPGSTVSYDDHKIYRVDLQPAATYGNFLYSKDVGDLLRYRANGGDVIQIRLRVENCVDGSAEDGYIGADGWNEAQGDILDTPRVEVRVDYRQSGVQKTVAPNAYTANIDVDNEGFQILTIPVGDYLANADFVECITLRFFHIKNNGNGKIVVDYIYMGPGNANREPVYGYDSGYTDDGKLSDGKSLYVEGNGVKLSDTTVKYTETTFSFAGTGFDLVSRTGKDQATIRVAVYDDPSMTEEHRIKSLTVNNKGELELFQIPVVSVQGLEYGTYYVAVWVNDKVTAAGLPQLPGVDLSSLTRGNEFYLDAIRIYDPIDVSGGTLTTDQAVALNAYKADKEAYQYIKEVRNILLSKDAFDNLSGTIDGAVFVDTEKMSAATETSPEGIGVENHITASIKTYDKIGPKNEVYLAPGQAVAFRLAIDTNIPVDSLDIGAKTVVAGGKAKLTVGFVVDNKTVEGKMAYNVQSATAQYHAVYGECIRFFKNGRPGGAGKRCGRLVGTPWKPQ